MKNKLVQFNQIDIFKILKYLSKITLDKITFFQTP